jgi:uncharacterized lipoprotein YajG
VDEVEMGLETWIFSAGCFPGAEQLTQEGSSKTTKYLIALLAFVGLMLAGCSDEQQSPVTSVAPNKGRPPQKVIIISHTGHD